MFYLVCTFLHTVQNHSTLFFTICIGQNLQQLNYSYSAMFAEKAYNIFCNLHVQENLCCSNRFVLACIQNMSKSIPQFASTAGLHMVLLYLLCAVCKKVQIIFAIQIYCRILSFLYAVHCVQESLDCFRNLDIGKTRNDDSRSSLCSKTREH